LTEVIPVLFGRIRKSILPEWLGSAGELRVDSQKSEDETCSLSVVIKNQQRSSEPTNPPPIKVSHRPGVS
jgi:hypothetical protein